MKLVAVVPAFNEEKTIVEVIEALHEQTRPPDEIMVVADNCTDATAAYAYGAGARIFHTIGNHHKKAGALNQALTDLLPGLSDHDAILIQDADSFLDRGFLECALSYLPLSPFETNRYDGVGGVFRGREGGSWCGWAQRNEYARYERDVRRARGRTLCLTGTAATFTVRALRHVALSRESGEVYDTRALTEDFELTLSLQHLGYRIIAPAGCGLSTEVMETWGDLWRQRLRWKRGAVENLCAFGLTRVTLKHWCLQTLSVFGLLVMAAYLLTLAVAILGPGITLHPLWLGVTGIFMLERFVTVRRRGLKHAFAGALLVFEMPFDLLLQGCHAKAYLQALVKTERTW